MIIIVVGKGGVGKTMISALLIKSISELKRSKILAIDADPASNFADALGIKALMSIGDIIENFANVEKKEKNNKGTNFLEYLRQKISENTFHEKNFDFIEMGRGEGQGCYCSVNDVLRAVLEEKQKMYEFIVVDCAAGLEHLSRKTATGADVLLVVTDTSEAGFRSAETIKKIAVDANVKEENIFLVINKVTNKIINEDAEKKGEKSVTEILNERIVNTKILEICMVPYDENVAEYNDAGLPLINIPVNSKAYVAVKEMYKLLILSRLMQTNGQTFSCN